MNFGRETEFLEFKKTTGELIDSMDDICAILNKHGHGTLWFGVKPNGDVVGQEIGAHTLDDIARYIKEYIKPMIYPTINEETIDGKTCIKVEFIGTERPYSSRGRYYLRVIDRSEEMTPNELRDMLSSTDNSSRWENNVTKYGLEAVDSDALMRFYKKAVSCGRLEPMIEYNESELLVGLGLMEADFLNNAGFYLFSNKKPVVLKIATYVTDERINFSDIRRLEDNIFNLVDFGYRYIIEKMNWRVESTGTTSRSEIPEVPVDAIREILVNSFAHADYRGVTENEIDITPTQIEIYNPGKFPINLTPEMFVNTRRKSQPRNKIILNTLFKCKDVEIFGSGFKKTYLLCKEAKVEHSYELQDDGFSFVFYRKNKTTNEIITPLKLIGTDTKILNKLKEEPTLTRNDLANMLGVSSRTIQRSLDKLVKCNKIIRIGSNKTGYWEIIG